MNNFFKALLITSCFLVSCNANSQEENRTELEIINDICIDSIEKLNMKFECSDDDDDDLIIHEDASLLLILDLKDFELLNNCLKIKYELKNTSGEAFSGYGKYNLVYETDEKTGILLSFDDYYKDNWESALDIFSEYDLTATWFPFGDLNRIGNFCNLALQKGHDVGYHTYSHIELVKGTSEDVVKQQCYDPLVKFYYNDIPLKSFAFPGGKYDTWMIPYLQGFYKYLRMFHNDPIYYNYNVINERRWFRSNSIDQKWLPSEDFKETIDKRLLKTKICKYIYPCTTHYILAENEHLYDKNGNIDDLFTIKEEDLRYLLRRINDFKLNSLKFRDL